ncbi:xanthine dehydrogenase family protein molybdopterin-binding subunit, partial [Neokomagataea sp. TBRC 2177]|nr:xanthine dehydrogenase family protein molybdopterin-binding subunit [Neokomagataea anthophila]
PLPTDIPLGYWRSVGESYNTFAVESAIDELALAAGRDPLAWRKSLLANDARSLGVLSAVDALSGWSTSAAPKGSARGLAFLSGFGSY